MKALPLVLALAFALLLALLALLPRRVRTEPGDGPSAAAPTARAFVAADAVLAAPAPALDPAAGRASAGGDEPSAPAPTADAQPRGLEDGARAPHVASPEAQALARDRADREGIGGPEEIGSD